MLNPAPTRLLIIDQDTLGENFIKQSLNPNGYEVIKVNSSSEGIQITQSWNPELIIINIMQPAVNGWKLCRKLRQHSQAPILVLAAVSDPNSIASWLDAGADDYLTKPFSSDILVAHLQKLTRRFNLKQNHPSITVA
jgi:two-component system response regulator ResD